MAKDPAFLFYYQDFLVGTDHMSLEQIGAYIKCLCHQANKGYIREEHMKNICLTHDNHMIVSEKFIKDTEGNFFNKRLFQEIEKRRLYSESRRNNRKICKTYVRHMENENENENKDINKDRIVKERKKEAIVPKDKYLTAVLLTKEEYDKLIKKFGQEGTDKRIYDLNNGICTHGYKYKSHYHAILSWDSRNERSKLV